MRLGAQLYSVRQGLTTPEDLRETFRKIKEIGYGCVQFSGAPKTDPVLLREISAEAGLPVVCTHSPWERILNDTGELIREHQIFGCPVIGLGSLPAEYRSDFAAGLAEAEKLLELPVKKIREAGLSFAYHNHNMEFVRGADGRPVFDRMLENHPDWDFIVDTYWVEYAGFSAAAYLRAAGARAVNVHYKDMDRTGARGICACGDGRLDFDHLTAVCREIGVRNVLVEEDNAASFGDPFEQMARSYRYLRPRIGE